MVKLRRAQSSSTSTASRSEAHDRAASLAASVYERLLSDLISLSIEPGARLTVDALARELAVSQTPIREALGRLEAEGLVVKTHLRGYRAAPRLNLAEFEALYEIRLLLEPHTARRAAQRRSSDQVRELETVAQSMVELLRSTGPAARYGEFAALDARLHDLVAEAGGNQLIEDTLARLHTHLHIFRLMQDRRVADEAAEEHRLLIDAIRRGDGLVAEAAMRSHIERSRERLLVAFS